MTKYLHYNTGTGIFSELDDISDRPELILIDEDPVEVKVIHGFIHQMIKKYGQELTGDIDLLRDEWAEFNN